MKKLRKEFSKETVEFLKAMENPCPKCKVMMTLADEVEGHCLKCGYNGTYGELLK